MSQIPGYSGVRNKVKEPKRVGGINRIASTLRRGLGQTGCSNNIQYIYTFYNSFFKRPH